jgi:hypothetical protein
LVAPVLLDFPVLFENIATHQQSDPDLKAIVDQLSLGDVPGYSLEKGVLHCKARYDHRPKIVVPQVLVPLLFSYFHDSPLGGHLGVRKTFIRFTSPLFGRAWIMILLYELEPVGFAR